MSPRSFWIILLKLVGVYIMVHAIDVVPQFIALFFPADPSRVQYDNWEVFVISLGMLAAYLAIVRLLVFRPDIVINKLKLDKRFEEEQFSFRIHRSTVVAIAIIIIGGLMVMNTLPIFFREVYFYYRSQTIDRMGPAIDVTTTLIDLCKIIIGCALVVNNRQVVNYIERMRRDRAIVQKNDEQIDNEIN